MGACCAAQAAPRPRSSVPRLGRRARERWLGAKEHAAETTAQLLLLEPSRTQIALPYLYAALGGNAEPTSPMTLKGGAAFVLFMAREMAFYGDALPPSVRSFAAAADLDFTCREPAETLIPRVAKALPWLADFSKDAWPHFEASCASWQLRRDGNCGEAFFDGRRFSLDVSEDTNLPIKFSYHGELTERHTREAFQLVRIGAAIWHRRTCRSAVAAFIDISLGNSTAVQPTVCVMGIRVQAPQSMLKALRHMMFHQVGYAPWLAACGDEAKQGRRLERIVKLGFVLDWKTTCGPTRGESAARGLQNRWRKALHHIYTADAAAVRSLAASAPPQMRFTLLCFARVVEEAVRDETLLELNTWLDSVVFCLVLDVCGDLVHTGAAKSYV